ncbi:MAG: iron export ABC transporter permease subunit FetB [Deltaproteobacteria bacterium]|nr:iron export ABC transporter permease subunit FetB [Deltaproteobacteria bacterium]
MMDEAILNIGIGQLALTVLLILLVVGLSFYEKLRLTKDYLVGVVRTVVQLFLVGYILDALFALNRWPLVLCALAVMVSAACQAGVGRLKWRQSRSRLFAGMGFALILGTGVTLFVVTRIVLRINPWYHPRYLIPLAGMIIGNAMNGATLGAERFRSELILRKNEVETLLCLGFDVRRASESARKSAMSAALLPMLNSMMVVGLVSLPGMMTGQILSGTSPLIAVRYQIVVMIMISSAVALSSFVMVRFLTRSFFTGAAQIRYEALH